MRLLTIHCNKKWLKVIKHGKTSKELQAKLNAGEELSSDKEEEAWDLEWMVSVCSYLAGVSEEPWWSKLVTL